MSIYLQQLKSEETYTLRQSELRYGLPLSSCKFEGDDDIETIHIGLSIDKNLIAVASFMQVLNVNFLDIHQYQLRGMAVLERFKRKKYGKQLLKYGESLVKERGGQLIWGNGRIIAVPFYLSQGYKTVGNLFEIDNVGMHYIIYKVL